MRNLKFSKLRDLAVVDISVFAERVLGVQLQPFHRRWLEFQVQNPKSLVLAPRGFGKSSVCNVLYCLWQLVRNPNIRILIVSNTHSQAQSFLWEIRRQIESNENFKSVFGDFRPGDRWSDSELVLANKTTITKESNITAVGAQGAIVSKHVDLLILDDLVDQENSRTELQREKLEQWLSMTLLPTLEPEGKIHFLGTRYHPEDLYSQLSKGAYKDFTLTDRALREDGSSLWPEKFSPGLLENKKSEMGTIAFDMQYQNDASAAQGDIFRYDWVQYYDQLPQHYRVWQGVDLAISQKQTADYFAMVTVAVDENFNIYVLDSFRGRLSFQQQVNIIVAKAQQFSPVRVAVESNAFQAAMANTLRQHTDVPVYPMQTQTDKVTRAQRLSARFENRKVFFRREQGDLIDELCRFPNGQHDDLFDALEFTIRLGCETYIKKPRPSDRAGLFVIEGSRASGSGYDPVMSWLNRGR